MRIDSRRVFLIALAVGVDCAVVAWRLLSPEPRIDTAAVTMPAPAPPVPDAGDPETSRLLPGTASADGALFRQSSGVQPADCAAWLERVGGGEDLGKRKTPAKPIPLDVLIRDVKEQDPWGVAEMPIAERIEGIRCLLTAEGDNRPGMPSGATRATTSQFFAEAPVQLSALYAVSYLIEGRFDHAGAVALRGDGANCGEDSRYRTCEAAMAIAFKAHRLWFKKVNQMGLDEAIEADIRPLDGTGLWWY